jgi:hypothetical protein
MSVSPRASLAAVVPTSTSPAPVLSTASGLAGTGTPNSPSAVAASIGSAPLVTATARAPRLRIARAARCGSAVPVRAVASAGQDGVTSAQCGAIAASTLLARAGAVSLARKLGS